MSMSSVVGGKLGAQARRLFDRLPPIVRRTVIAVRARREGVREQQILGTTLLVEGSTHLSVDYDDAWLIGLISESSGFVDVGCNIGYFALASCVLRPEAQVLAIDANPECAAVTAANLVRNGFGTRSRVVSAFVSDKEASVRFNTVGLGAAGSGVEGLARTAEQIDAATTVRSFTLSSILESTGFVTDLVKVDVEGAEREVLAGASDAVARWKPRFMVEMHSGENLPMRTNAADVLAWCDQHDYDAWYLATGERLADPGPLEHRGRCHLLLQERGAPFPSIIEGIPQSAAVDLVLNRLGRA